MGRARLCVNPASWLFTMQVDMPLCPIGPSLISLDWSPPCLPLSWMVAVEVGENPTDPFVLHHPLPSFSNSD